MSLHVGGRELLRVEVLEARADGTAKLRLWFYKWWGRRPYQPYVDIELTYREKSETSLATSQPTRPRAFPRTTWSK